MVSSFHIKTVAMIATVAILLSAVGVGCAPTPVPSTPTPVPSTPTPVPSTPTPVPSTPSTTQQKNLELRVALNDFAGENLDPILGLGDNAKIINLMYNNAFELGDKSMTGPGIVEKWEIAPDGLSWTFHIRKDVIFHDGSKLTAQDVKFSYERSVSKDATYASSWVAMLGDKPHVDVIDDYTVQVYTNGVQPYLLIYSSWFSPCMAIVPKAYIEAKGLNYFRSHPIGTGVYKFVRQVPGDLMAFEAVDYKHYKGVVPDFKRVTLILIPEETTRIALLKTGAVDETPVSLESSIELEQNKGFTTRATQNGLSWFAFVGAYHPLAKGMPIADIRVRQALSLAINREEIINTILYGKGKMPPPTRLLIDHPDLSAALRQKWTAWATDNFRYDPVKAAQLLKDAGYGNGFDLTLWSVTDESAPANSDLVQASAAYWQKIGVHTNIVPADQVAWKARRMVAKTTELVGKMGIVASSMDEPLLFEQMKIWTSKWGFMDLLTGNKDLEGEMDTLYPAAMSETDLAKANTMLDRMLEIQTSSWTTIPIVIAPVMYAFGPRVNVYLPTVMQGSPIAAYYAQWKYTGVEPSK